MKKALVSAFLFLIMSDLFGQNGLGITGQDIYNAATKTYYGGVMYFQHHDNSFKLINKQRAGTDVIVTFNDIENEYSIMFKNKSGNPEVMVFQYHTCVLRDENKTLFSFSDEMQAHGRMSIIDLDSKDIFAILIDELKELKKP
jgi:hypothetical protein